MTQQVIVYIDLVKKGKPFNPATIFDDLVKMGEGVLSDEHAASSYGNPVLLFAGNVYGPGDKPSWVLSRVAQAPRNDLLRRWNELKLREIHP
jgi:nucleoside-diphosphate-sugar epimerase